MKPKVIIILAGGVIGALAVMLVMLGNPLNMGFCIACFLRDMAGGLGLHRAAPVQYIRPEILGLVIGAFATAIFTREFRPLGGSSTLTRFVLGFLIMIGMLVFLGCPVRMLLRLAGGDLNALLGLAGLVVGVAAGVAFLRKGFSLGRAAEQNKVNSFLFPAIIIVFLILLLVKPPFIFFSQTGPGSLHAPLAIALAAGILAGVLAQRSRLCMVGGIRDSILTGDFYLLYGFFALFIIALIGNLIFGFFKPGFIDQPIAHNDGTWNFLGMALAGFGSVLLGGCPLRQLISASEGNADSAITILGLLAGAAFAHNFGLAASPKGVPAAGQVAVIISLVIVFLIALFNSRLILSGKGEPAGK